jgi:hypothetical protein
MATVYIQFQKGDESTFGTSLQNTKEGVTVSANSTTQYRSGLLTPSQDCALSVDLNVGGTFALYTADFSVLIASTSLTTPVSLANIGANITYGWAFTATVAPTLNGLLFALQARQLSSISQWFPLGFTNLIQLGSTVSRVVAADGTVTYTFTNYPVVAGQNVALAQAGPSVQSGTITLTSTVPAFANQSEAFTSPSGIITYLNPSSTGNVSGTVVLTVTGSGVTDYVRTFYAFP